MNRRDLLQGAAAMGIGVGAPRMLLAQEAADGPAEKLTLPSDPESQCRAMVRAYGNEGGDPCVFKTRGKVFAVQENAVTPMYGFLGSETGWWKQVEEHVWVRYPSTVSFFTDLESGGVHRPVHESLSTAPRLRCRRASSATRRGSTTRPWACGSAA